MCRSALDAAAVLGVIRGADPTNTHHRAASGARLCGVDRRAGVRAELGVPKNLLCIDARFAARFSNGGRATAREIAARCCGRRAARAHEATLNGYSLRPPRGGAGAMIRPFPARVTNMVRTLAAPGSHPRPRPVPASTSSVAARAARVKVNRTACWRRSTLLLF